MTFSLELVDAYLRDRVAPQANTLDHSVSDLRTAFAEFGRQGWLGLKIPIEWGGSAVSTTEFQCVQELVAQYSGSLAFLQAQHQSAGGLLSRSANQVLQRDYLPAMTTGEIAIGIAFSHLRRAMPPLKALPVADGFLLDGTIPWITGYGIFQFFIGAAILPDQRSLYGLLPFSATQQVSGGYLQFSAPMALAAMTSTSTVTAEVQQWFLPTSQVVCVNAADAIQTSDRQNVLQHSFYALGCTKAGLDLIEQIGRERSQAFIHEAHTVLQQEWHQCRTAIYAADMRTLEERLPLRAWAIELGVRCAHVAVTLSAGMANALSHPAQRIYREAMVFTVTGQTSAVMVATLQRLIAKSHTQPS
jgi:alkylation response protein AidB-like acyl-CoA dehydrogenase